jgi:hypothetical protein
MTIMRVSVSGISVIVSFYLPLLIAAFIGCCYFHIFPNSRYCTLDILRLEIYLFSHRLMIVTESPKGLAEGEKGLL